MSGKVPLPSSLPPPLAPLPNTPPRSLCRSLLSWCSLSRAWYCRKSRFFCSWRSLVVSISCFSSALSRWLSMRILAVCSCRHSDACYVRGRGKKERHDQETGRGNRKRKIFKRQRYTPTVTETLAHFACFLCHGLHPCSHLSIICPPLLKELCLHSPHVVLVTESRIFQLPL